MESKKINKIREFNKIQLKFNKIREFNEIQLKLFNFDEVR